MELSVNGKVVKLVPGCFYLIIANESCVREGFFPKLAQCISEHGVKGALVPVKDPDMVKIIPSLDDICDRVVDAVRHGDPSIDIDLTICNAFDEIKEELMPEEVGDEEKS